MTYLDIHKAVPAFQKLVGQNLPLRISYKLSKMVRRVNEELDFFREKEAELKGRHEYKVPPKEYDELLKFEIDWDESKIEIPLDTDINLSCSDIDALAPFIEFKEVTENAQV